MTSDTSSWVLTDQPADGVVRLTLNRPEKRNALTGTLVKAFFEALEMLREDGLPYIVVLTDPTYGSVSASYAMLGDLNIAEPGALDRMKVPRNSTVVRISPDDAFVIAPAGPGAKEPTVKDDPHAIVTPEHGFSGANLSAMQVADIALHHIEWQVPKGAGLSQGQIAGVPAKLVVRADGSGQILVACAACRELDERLNGVQA